MPFARKIRSKKNYPRDVKLFLLGFSFGIAALYLPIHSEFSKVRFVQSEWGDLPYSSLLTRATPPTAPLIEREGYTLAYDGRTRNPHWVYHKLTSQYLASTPLSREEERFKEDLLVPNSIRATLKDYQGSGLDRGHLCPALDCANESTLSQSFLLSNTIPQAPGLNRGYWKKLENYVRSLTREYPIVHVFSGPLYLSTKRGNGKRSVTYQVIGKREVAVPTHLFLLFFAESASGKVVGKGFIVPNKAIEPNTSLKKFSTSIEEIEEKSGILFTHLKMKEWSDSKK